MQLNNECILNSVFSVAGIKMEKNPFTLSFISEAHQSLTGFSVSREEEKHQMTALGCYLDKVEEE